MKAPRLSPTMPARDPHRERPRRDARRRGRRGHRQDHGAGDTRMVRLLRERSRRARSRGRADLHRGGRGRAQVRLRGAIERARQDEIAACRGARPSRPTPCTSSRRASARSTRFCADLLREHPVEAGIDPLFEMAPDDVAGELFGRAPRPLVRAPARREPSEGVRRVLRWRASSAAARGMLRSGGVEPRRAPRLRDAVAAPHVPRARPRSTRWSRSSPT